MNITVDYFDITKRFDLLIFETAQEYLEKKEKKLAELSRAAELERREMEKVGVCDCGELRPRWVRNGEFYICYKCFIHDLDCESSVMVPSCSADSMPDYVSEVDWDELWEWDE